VKTPIADLVPHFVLDHHLVDPDKKARDLNTPFGPIIFSPNGHLMATRGQHLVPNVGVYNALFLWDVQTGQLVRAVGMTWGDFFRGPTPESFTPDGRFLITTEWDGEGQATTKNVQLWEVPSMRPMRTLSGYESPVAISPDGRLLAASAGDGQTIDKVHTEKILLLELANGQERTITLRREIPFGTRITVDKWLTALAFSPGSDRLALGLGFLTGVPEMWRVVPKLQEDVLGQGKVWEGVEGVGQIVFSRDGRKLAYLCGNRIIVRDAYSGSELRNIQIGPQARSIAFAPDERWLIFFEDGAMKLLDLASGEQFRTIVRYDPSDRFPYDASFSPDGRWLAVISSTDRPGLSGPAGKIDFWRIEH
jgi:WD40 repeat protein